nr:reverse transcriptase domain-containing protein [Tanacetum cinerariifolium]
MMSPSRSIVASLENINGFLAVNTSLDDLIRTDFKQEGVVPKVMLHLFDEGSLIGKDDRRLDTQFFFSKECVEAFQTLKKKLTEAPILIALDWDLPFELMCDASDFAI